MSEWQKNVENRAKHTTAMYILEDGNSALKAQRSAMHRRRASDMAFGLFCIMMGLTMCILSAGLFIASKGGAVLPAAGSGGFAAFYLIFGVSLLIRGIAGLVY